MDKLKIYIKLNRSYLIDLVIFLVMGVAFIASSLYVQQSLSAYSQTQNKIASLSLTYQVNDASLVQFQKSDLSTNSFLDALPTQDTIINWLNQTEEMAKLSGVTQSITFTNADLTENTIIVPQSSLSSGTPTISANIVLAGTYNGIVDYVNLLNHSYYYTQITSITIAAIKPATSSSGSSSVTPTPTNPNVTVTSTISLNLFIRDASVQATR